MRNLISLIILLTVLLLSPLVHAINIDMQVKDSFSENETLTFEYTIMSDKQEKVTYKPYIHCPNAANPGPEEKEISLKAGEPYKGVYQGAIVTEEVEPQICVASLRLGGFQEFLEKKFRIDTKPSFWLEPKTCTDASCSYRQGIFAPGEEIFMDYESEVDNPAISTLLRYPDGEETRINLPFSIMAEQIGAYTLEISASREGYKNMRQILPFVVIKEHAVVRDASICNADGVCSGMEDYQNCPQDCSKPSVIPQETTTAIKSSEKHNASEDRITGPQDSSGKAGKPEKSYLIYYIILAIVIMTLVLFLAYRKIQEKKKWEQLETKYTKK